MPKTLRLILGDQLNENHSWFKEKSDNITYVMMEVKQETGYVKHHIQKVVAFFLAMRRFTEKMEKAGHQFIYLNLDDEANQQDISKNIQQLIKEHGFEAFAYQLPDEYRLDQQMNELREALEVDVEVADTEHFLTSRDYIEKFFKGKKTYLMENFYRHMRKELDILMEGDEPVGEKWNYDHENRKKYDGETPVPEIKSSDRDTSEIVALLEKQGVETFGRIDEKEFLWPISREEALKNFDDFLDRFFANFGKYEDAMEEEYPFLFHSRVSFALNSKMLSPLEVVKKAEKYWADNQKEVSLAQVEGFIRQIIGWREFMRGVYWAKMPDFAKMNYFEHKNKLPDFYWTGKTKMNCLNHAINNSLDHAYAHHIQRLMVTGNFALLAGVSPDELDAWYLGIYIDAIEWVEITNTRGMSQFADGGIIATKPYVSSANYIDKMSNYCKGCHYSKTKKVGDKACPFNSLYWHFFERNRDKLSNNFRVGMMYRTWDKMDKEKRKEILEQAESYLDSIDEL